MTQHILVAGCQDQTQLAVCELLYRSGLFVHVATSVGEAVGAFNLRPSLILVDLSMEEGNGIDVISAARAYRLQTKVAAIVSACDISVQNWVGKYRPDAVFGKPFDFDDFTDWLSEFDLYRSLARFPAIYNQFAYASEAA